MLTPIDGETLRRLVPLTRAVEALEAAFASPSLPEAPLRTRLETAWGDLLLMPATGEEGVGVKVVTIALSNPGRGLPLIHAQYVLFSAGTMEPVAVVDGQALTALRAAAVSALATRHLARPDASRLVVFGAGVQAAAHVEAMIAVRPIRTVRVVSPRLERAAGLAERARAGGVDASAGEPGDVAHADIVCTCTTSPVPVFDGSLLAEGAHVNAIGSYHPDTREVDDQTVARARIVVETREAALAEAGDLLIPMGRGVIDPASVVADLAEVVGGAPVRTQAGDITLFKSVGVAFEDLVVAAAAVEGLSGRHL